MSTHFKHRSIGVALCVIFCLQAQIARAEWSEAENLIEINDPIYAQDASLTADQLVICFIRDDYLWEAWRQDPYGSFTDQRVVSELGSGPTSIRDLWIFTDGLRLYYAEILSLDGKMQRVIKMAVRASVQDQWREARTFLEIHVNGIIDTSPALSGDELTMIWYNQRFVGAPELRTFSAARASIEEPFSNIREIPELSTRLARHPHLSPDGLTVYFTAGNAETGIPNIFKATRGSLDAPFGDFEVLGICGPDLAASRPWLSPDEKTIYFNSSRGPGPELQGIFVSYWIDDPYDVAVESIEAAIAAKREAIAVITSGLDKERAALEALNELRATGEVDPVNIHKTEIRIFLAINRQTRAIAELEKSIRELEKALEELEPEGTDTPAEGD